MNRLIGFWPIKSFFQYVFQRSLGKFLRTGIDLELYDFSKKKITFKNLDINTQLVNDSLLKDSPFKLISCTIGKLRVNNLSLNFLSESINIEAFNIDIILMPVKLPANRKDSGNDLHADGSSSQGENSGSDSPKGEASKLGAGKKGSPTPADSSKTEEFNILNNIVNRILSTLEVKVQCITVRVLTEEITEGSNDIPTFLLRAHNIEYKKNTLLQKKPTYKQGSSDIQAILQHVN